MTAKLGYAARILLGASVTLGCLEAQVATFAPQQPKWGEALQVTYDPALPGAQLRLSDQVLASVGIYFEDYSLKRFASAMTVSGNRLHYSMTIPQGACLLQISFVTAHDYDSKTTLTAVLFRPDGKPARDAYHHLMWDHAADAERYFQQEIELYPDNLTAYRTRWFLSDSKAKELPAIREDLVKIGAAPKELSAEWLYAMSYAYLRTGDLEHARSTLRQLIQAFPESPLTTDALNYHIFRSSGDARREAQQWESELVKAHPASNFAAFTIQTLAADKDFPFEAVQSVVRERLKVEPDDPGPYLALATASLARRRDFPQALAGLRSAIGLLLEGKYHVLFDPSGTLTQRRLADAYRLSAEVELVQGATSEALADVKAAESFEPDNAPASHLLETSVWDSLSDWRRAESAALEAWRRDPQGSEDRLRQAYEKVRGNGDGFQSFLEANRTAVASAQQKRRPFPFDVNSLDGKHWSLQELKGKVVVLNFWFVGCLPCRTEIPVLNQLVEQYKDVVFLGFALDPEEQLKDFLKKFPFRYEIVADSQKVADGFRVPAYPTHIVIDPAGEIAYDGMEDLEALKTALAHTVLAAH